MTPRFVGLAFEVFWIPMGKGVPVVIVVGIT